MPNSVAGRRKILNEPGVFTRMRSSADASEWCGQLARIYLTSVLWNLRRKHFAVATSRTAFGVAGVVTAGQHAFSPNFWRALFSRYESDTFRRGFAAAQVAN